MTTPIDTDGLMKLLEGATPTPWSEQTGCIGKWVEGRYEWSDIASVNSVDRDHEHEAGPNAALIVAAVNALPELLAERERLREALAILNAANEFDGEPDDKKLFVAMRVADLRRASAALTGGTQ